MATNIFAQGISTLVELGIADVLLPFLLVFTIIFAILQKSEIFKDANGKVQKNVNVILSLILGLLVIIPHVVMGNGDPFDGRLNNGWLDVVEIMNNSLPNISLIVVMLVMVMILIGILDIKIFNTPLAGLMAIISLVAVGFIFLASAGIFSYNLPPWLDFMNDDETRGMVIIILVFGLLIWFITREPKTEEGGAAGRETWVEKWLKHPLQPPTTP
jgi:hypothetical protein